jgi:3-isopropylmalate/(R)-2-methylmalate dehydratase small subunit
MKQVKGRVWKLGDNVNTDNMSPAQYMFSIGKVSEHCLEAVRPEFCVNVMPGDILLGGNNFGTGSSRETAPRALKELGIGLIISKSFARIFYRNCIDIGLPAIIDSELYENIEDGDIVVADLRSNRIVNETQRKTFTMKPIPGIMMDILNAGGLISYALERKW